MKMTNIKIEVRDENYIVVTADTKRFGPGEVMCECNTFEQCFDYIRRELGLEKDAKLLFTTMLIMGSYTDWTGKTLPTYMWDVRPEHRHWDMEEVRKLVGETV